MGQQQLLLIVLGIIIVGIAVYTGITLFSANAVEAKRNNVTGELVNLASMAQGYYLRPTTMGGGNHSFTGWIIPAQLVETENGNYVATVSDDEVVIVGTGNQIVTGNDSVKVKINVKGDKYQITILK